MKNYVVQETITYCENGNYSFKKLDECFTNKRKALEFAKILVKQRNAGEVITANKNMKSVAINVTLSYGKEESLKSGLTGENIYHFDKDY